MTDPISDMLTRIRNATSAGHSEVVLPTSKIKKNIAELMKSGKFIRDFEEVSEGNRKMLKISLKYSQDEKGKNTPAILGIRRVSRQGQRIYAGKTKLPFVKSGYGLAIISTSKGLMADSQARRTGLGGEVICEIW